MKICPNCKAQLEEDAVFCGECGQKVPEVAAEEAEKTSQKISGTSGETPSKKVCSNCGAELAPNKSFCADCGALIQEKNTSIEVSEQSAKAIPLQNAAETLASSSADTAQKLVLVGAAMTFVSVFLPIISGGFEVISLLGANIQGKILGLALAVLSLIAYQSSKNQKYEIVTAVGQTILWPIIAMYIYCSAKMPPFLWAMIRCDIGGYCLILGSLLLIVSGLLLDGTPLNASALGQKWKEYIAKPIQVSNFSLPSFGWIIGVPVVLGFVLGLIK